MSFVVAPVMKFLKSVARCRLPMIQQSAHKVMKMLCVYFQCLHQLAGATVVRLHKQCLRRKWAGVALAAVATVKS
jgi:hypothetical protein